MSILDINCYRSSTRYKVKTCPILDYEAVYEAVFIIKEDLYTGNIIEISDISAFLFNSRIMNLELNTRLTMAKKIVMFLNSLFFDREYYIRNNSIEKITNLTNIEDFTINDGNTFLADYKYGKVGRNKLKSKETIEQMEDLIVRLCRFLCVNEKYKMKYITKDDFKIEMKEVKRNSRVEKKQIVKSPFEVIYGKSKISKRLQHISFFAVWQFILLALEQYPMIALAIALEAFAGVREGEAVNTSWYNIVESRKGGNLEMFSIDLREKPQLRDDGVNVGEIKSPAIAYVHPQFLYIFDLIWNEHQRYLEQDVKKRNKFGAIFLNRDGKAMTDRSYYYHFMNLSQQLRIRLRETGIERAINEADRMLELEFTPHTLRYFFSQYIAGLKNINIFEVAMWRRDTSLNSVMEYIRNNPYLIDDIIKKYQDKQIENMGL